MHLNLRILISAWLAGSVLAPAQSKSNDPRLGYLYPAGAQRNTTVEIIAAGQRLNSLNHVRVSGNGVTAKIIQTYRPLRNLDGDQRKLLQWHVNCRRAEINGTKQAPKPKPPEPITPGATPPVVELPEHPLLDMLDSIDLAQIEHWTTYFQRISRMQPSQQLGEMMRIELTIAPDAAPGVREIRFGGQMGLTNPVRFEIGTLPEIRENEPNENIAGSDAAGIPCTFNGQIQAGDVDLFRFHARRGQNVIIRGMARSLIPYLADAVPGWFQMVLQVRDSNGREVAYGDDFRFEPDPVLFFKVPEDGDYVLEVHDSIYRGREDFIYRISVGELPFVTARFPLGGRQGEPLVAAVRGWNLPADKLKMDTKAGGHPQRTARMLGKSGPSNDVPYAVDTLPEFTEAEPNDDFESAADVSFPSVINGTIGKPGDADVFRIHGRKNQELIVGVIARRLRSPLDSVIHIATEQGTVLGWNDDAMEVDGTLHLGDGLLTHHADSRVRVKLPADGPVFVRIADTQGQGGPEFAYRIRICEARPDFELRVTPSVVNVVPGTHVPLQVHVMRNDGFEGGIKLALKDAPPGFRLSGATIPAGVSQVRVTLTTPPQTKPGVFPASLTGTADDGGKPFTRTALAADDTMQAFLWRHLVTADEWLLSVTKGRGKPQPVELASPLPLRVPADGLAEVKVTLPRWIIDRGVELEPSGAPPGIRLSAARKTPDGMAFDIIADASAAPGLKTNLIVVLFSKNQPAKKGGKVQQRYPIGTLPAIPISLVSPTTP